MNTILLAYQDAPEMKSATPVYLHDILDKPMIEYAIELADGDNTTIIVNEQDLSKYEKFSKVATIKGATDENSAYTAIKESLNDTPTIIVDANIPMMEAQDITDFATGCQEDGGEIITLDKTEAEYTLIYLRSATLAQECVALDELLSLQQVIEFEIPDNFSDFVAIKNRYDLSTTEDQIREFILTQWLYDGVTIKNMDSVTIGPDVNIGQDTIIYPNTYITGKVTIGSACKLGPFLRIRQAAKLGKGVKLGNFVELKNAELGDKSASAHLSYLGDCSLGERVNVGCGAITVNYDGANKHKTTIEDDAFIGCNVNMIAPITVGESALVAAGSTITKDVPAKNLSFGRARQVNKGGYERKKKNS